MCGDTCFNPLQDACSAQLVFNQSLVGVGGVSTQEHTNYQLCDILHPFRCDGMGCYTKQRYVCHTQNLAALTSPVLCPVEARFLCGSNCYSPDKYNCINGQLQAVSVN